MPKHVGVFFNISLPCCVNTLRLTVHTTTLYISNQRATCDERRIIFVPSSLREGSKEYPETSRLSYNTTPRPNPKKSYISFFVTKALDHV